jgi:hypothetical protein
VFLRVLAFLACSCVFLRVLACKCKRAASTVMLVCYGSQYLGACCVLRVACCVLCMLRVVYVACCVLQTRAARKKNQTKEFFCKLCNHLLPIFYCRLLNFLLDNLLIL